MLKKTAKQPSLARFLKKPGVYPLLKLAAFYDSAM
jgi:hypothetical protein